MSSAARDARGEVLANPEVPPLRLLVCTPKYAPQIGGAETWLRALAVALADRGHDLQVVTRAVGAAPTDHLVDGIPVRRVQGGRTRLAREIAGAIADRRPDAVLAHYSALPPAVFSAHRWRVPVVGIVHDVYGWRESLRIKGPVLGPLRFAGLEGSMRVLRPDAFLVNSRATAVRLAPLAGGRPVTVVPAGADHLPIGAAETASHSADVVFVGRLVPQKGASDLVEALRLLERDGVASSAVIVGRGPEESTVRRAAEGLGGVRLAGGLSDDELDRTIRGASVLALPSTREGWGLAITEAAARGVPYVAYDIPAVREQHHVLQGGVLVEPSPEALAAALGALLRDPSERERLRQQGLANAATMRWADAAAVAERAIASILPTSAGGAR